MPQNLELLSDLIKIGIPSLVALAGTLSSVAMAWWAHKQNLNIEGLKHRNEAEKERYARTGELVKLCAIEVGELHHHLTAYASVLFARMDTEAAGEPWPQAEQELLAERFQEAVAALHKHLSIQSYVVLLGDADLSKKHQEYLGVVSRLLDMEGQKQTTSLEEHDRIVRFSRDLHHAVLNRLSAIFLMRDA